MKSELKNLGKHTIIYGAGILLGRIVSFIMLPIYTRYLTPADYGVLELLTITTDVISMIVGIGLTSTVMRFYSKYDSQEEKNKVVSTALVMMFVPSLLINFICILLSDKFSTLVFGTADYTRYFQLSFIMLFLQAGVEIPMIFIRLKQDSTLFVVINFLKLILQLSLNIYFVVILKIGLAGILYSSLISSIVMTSFLTFYIIRWIGFAFSFPRCIEMLRFGYPLIFWSLGSFILTFSDRYFLNIYSDLRTVGIYSLAYKFGFLLATLVGPFSLIWEPKRFEIAKQHDGFLIYKKVFMYLNIVLLMISLMISVFIKDILTLMTDPSYWEAYRLVPIILIAYIFQTWTAFCNIGLFIREKTSMYGLSAAISVVIVTLANVLLIPSFGAYGAAWATVIAFGIRFIVVLWYAQKEYYVDFGWVRNLQLMAVFMFMVVVRFIWPTPSTIYSILLSLGFSLLFGIVVYKFFIEDFERDYLKQLIQKPRSIINLIIPKTT